MAIKRTKEQIIADSIKEGYNLLMHGTGNYDKPVADFRSQGYDVRFWYMTREKEVNNRQFDIYGLMKSSKKSAKKDIVAPVMKHFDINPEQMNCFLKMLGVKSLASITGVEKVSKFSARQKKAQKNFKYCANDMWQHVNSWYDQHDEGAREYMLNAEELFMNIYDDALTNIYDEGMCSFGQGASLYMKDIKFCGKKFLETLCFYYTAKLMEEAFYEVEGTMDDAQKIMNALTHIKERVGC